MRNKDARHLRHFIVLLSVMAVGIFLGLFFANNRTFIRLLAINLSLFYFLWGLYHHHQEKTLYFEVVLEYLLLSIFGAALIIAVI